MSKKYTHWLVEPILDRNIPIHGIIHVGSHYGQEYPDYVTYGIENIVFIEPLKANFNKMLESYDFTENVKFFNTACGNFTGEVEMNVETANWGMSSSILEAGTHLIDYPKITFDTKETVKIDKLDNLGLDMSLYNALNVDVQGYELEVFKGAEETLKSIDIIFTEVNTGEVYKGCTKLPDLDAFLEARGFVRIHCHMYGNLGYGDAIYLK